MGLVRTTEDDWEKGIKSKWGDLLEIGSKMGQVSAPFFYQYTRFLSIFKCYFLWFSIKIGNLFLIFSKFVIKSVILLIFGQFGQKLYKTIELNRKKLWIRVEKRVDLSVNCEQIEGKWFILWKVVEKVVRKGDFC